MTLKKYTTQYLLVLTLFTVSFSAMAGARLPNLLWIDLNPKELISVDNMMRAIYSDNQQISKVGGCLLGHDENIGGFLYIDKRPSTLTDSLISQAVLNKPQAISRFKNIVSNFTDDDGSKLDGALVIYKNGTQNMLTAFSLSKSKSITVNLDKISKLKSSDLQKKVCLAIKNIERDFRP